MTDQDDFGPMETATPNAEDKDKSELLLLREKVSSLEKCQEELLTQQKEADADFGKKRAKFKEIFVQKEAELSKERALHSEAQERVKTLTEQLERVKNELEGVRTAAAVSVAGKEDEVDELRRQYQGEVASLQHIMNDAAEAAARSASDDMKEQNLALINENERLEQEITNLRSQLSQEREGFLASVAKTLQKKVGVQPFGKPSSEDENLEDSMRKAQEDAEVLRSVVMPLEEEITSLKSKLRAAEMQLVTAPGSIGVRTMPDGAPTSVSPTPARKSPSLPELDSSKDPEERVKEVLHYLKAEKAARTDLEMYVAVLNTQKSVLQEDSEKLRAELHEVCRLLEQEKKEHSELKWTWQMANDQFLESQRLMMMDMRRMESVLSHEQQRQIAELQKRDHEREAQEKKVKELEEMREKQRIQKEEERKAKEAAEAEEKRLKADFLIGATLEKSKSGSKGSINSGMFDDVPDIRYPPEPTGMSKSASGSRLAGTPLDGFLDSGIHEARSLPDVQNYPSSGDVGTPTSLTDAQLRAIRDPTPEAEACQTLLATAKSRSEGMSMEGRRIVSEHEWELLQRELKASREKLGRPCDMCSNYEAQLQAVQEELKDASTKAQTLDRQLTAERKASANQLEYQKELETNLKEVAEDSAKQLSDLSTKVGETEKYLLEVKQQFNQSQTELLDQLKTLTAGREDMQKELTKLQNENDSLVGKHSKHAQQLQNETINLPNNLDEMQLKLLQFREEMIAAKVAKEQAEETLRSEILFLKDQVVAEQQEKTTLEETMTQEITSLTEQLALLQNMKSDLEKETSMKSESDQKLKEAEHSLKSIQAKSKQIIQALKQQVEEQSNARTKCEQDMLSLRAKVQSLQVDLENSEAVQRDFVKLSQSLQIQLEKIRQAETEVRWQHEEDVDECSNCKQSFSVTRRKHHCRHCGKIFCAECTSKSVNSGSNFRPSKVCDVCHTILIKDATPFFSTELPATPD